MMHQALQSWLVPDRAAEPQATPVERSYLEVIFYLMTRPEPVIAAQLARWLHVRPPTVTHSLQQLQSKGLIQRDSAGAITLTQAGTVLAEQIVRRHRLLECFLYSVLGLPWHEIHREAARLEPVLSPLMEARIVELVGEVTTCPHGNPIPGHCSLFSSDMRLLDAPIGGRFQITRIDEEAGEDSCTLQLLATRGLLPGTLVLRLPNAGGAVALRRSEQRLVLSRRVAGMVWGLPIETETVA